MRQFLGLYDQLQNIATCSASSETPVPSHPGCQREGAGARMIADKASGPIAGAFLPQLVAETCGDISDGYRSQAFEVQSVPPLLLSLRYAGFH